MQIQIYSKDIELTPEIKAYAESKIGNLDKFLENIELANVDLVRTTNHHRQGEVFEVSVKLVVPGKDHFSKFSAETLFAAIDGIEEELKKEIRRNKGKLEAKQMKGLRKIKQAMTSFLSRKKDKTEEDTNIEE